MRRNTLRYCALRGLKNQAKKLGAEAAVNIGYERKFSADYLQDLYFINGDAVVWQ